jgi:tetratricopeptide (TPR) repeat protein
MPGGVQNMLRSRLSGLDNTAWQVLTAAAVIGRSFTFDILQETSGRSEVETLNSLDSLLSRKLIDEICPEDERSHGSFDFTHEKMRQFVYEQAPVTRQRLLHRRVAEALIKGQRLHPETGASTSQIARHLQLSGAETLAAEYYKNAGDEARLVFAHQVAIHHYQAAIALGYPEPAAIHEAIGDLYTRRAEYGLAIASYHSAASLADQVDQARLEHKLAVVYHRRGDYELADGHFYAILELAELSSTQEELAAFFADWSQTAYKRGDRIRAQTYAEKSLTLAGVFPHSRSLSKAHNILGILARANGFSDQALWHLENSLQIARGNHDLVGQVAAYNNLARIFQDQKQIDSALQLTRDALAICQQINDRHHEAALFDLMAELYHANGQDDEAMDYLKQAVQRFAEIRSGTDESSPEIWMLSEW